MLELFLRKLRELFLPKVLESFWSNVVEQTAASAFNSMKNIIDFKPNLETLEANMKLLSVKASDVEKQITNEEIPGRKKRKREVEEWLEQVKSFEKEIDELRSRVESQAFIMRFVEGGKATELNEQVLKLVEQTRDFGELLYVCGTSGDTFLTDGMFGKAFSENLETIMKLLESREVSSIGAHGMGGGGKTTLAKHVNNRLLQQSEGRVFWITVSQEFTVTSLQDKIAHLLSADLSDEDEEAIRATRLHRVLSVMKNSVLILDDVWEKIDMLKVGFPVSKECCRLIITTRSLEVCRRICFERVFRVEKLGEEDAWKLFNETLRNDNELGPQVEEIAKSMARMCDGLPLGIITVAGSMRGKKAICTWQNALSELKICVARGQDNMGEVDEVLKVLKYSFNMLNRNDQSKSNEFNIFQLCFLYCSSYPEGYEIVRDDLVSEFISGGLLDERRGRRAKLKQGQSILDKLVGVCLLESCVDDDGEERVKMHDLVRSMALKIGEGKYMVRAGERSLKEIPNQEEWTNDLENVSLANCGIDSIGEGVSPDCPKLSTLLFWGNRELKVIPESFFSKMQGLHTLDLCNTQIRMLPNFVSDLTCLKALLLGGCDQLESVPYLGKLKGLKELHLFGTAIKEAPRGLEELFNLEFLSLMGARNLELIPSGLFLKLACLQHVSTPSHINAPIAEIQNLKLLEEFNGTVSCVEDFNSFIRSTERRRERHTWYEIKIIVGDGEESFAPTQK